MENNIFSLKDIAGFKKSIGKKRLVLVGGCFDLLHWGHVTFLEKARQQGDILVIALESDEFILKNKKRPPIHTQKQRAHILCALRFVDYVLLLPYLQKDSQYDDLVQEIHPQVIAITEKDPLFPQKSKQAKAIGAKLAVVMPLLENYSSSTIRPYADLSRD